MNDSDGRQEPADSKPAGQSRVDREIDEILLHSDKLRPFPDPPSKRRLASRQDPLKRHSPSLSGDYAHWRTRLLGSPLLLALAAGMVAFVIADGSRLLANLFAFLAIVLVFLPIIERYRNPQTDPGTRMWRGQAIDSRPVQPSPLSHLRRWWSSQQR